jgi:predicted  nucleic acid-binding Zn-ribbon protein
MRLATEELWSRLCGTIAPAALTQSLGEIRRQIVDQQQLAQIRLAEQTAELQALAASVAEQHESLGRQKRDLQEWAERRQSEIDEQAKSLRAREHEFHHQESKFEDISRQWREERRGYQQEIRRLLAQLRKSQLLAA